MVFFLHDKRLNEWKIVLVVVVVRINDWIITMAISCVDFMNCLL